MHNYENQYLPDFVVHPGETLLETLEELGMTQAELAIRTGRPKKTINEIIKGKTAITPETALQLELVLDVPARVWNELERNYQEYIALLSHKQQLASWTQWLGKVPYKELVQKGWLEKSNDKIEQVRQCLAFFGVVSPEQWEIFWGEITSTAFRQSASYDIDHVSVAAWLRKAELNAFELDCDPFDEQKFKQVLAVIKSLTQSPPSPELYQREVVEVCRQAGVAVVVIPRLSKSRVWGASQWLSPRKAVIALSLYQARDDHFWFTFFHEAAHILLHSKKEIYIDREESENLEQSEIETEANTYAGNFLIPQNDLEEFIQSRSPHNGSPFFEAADICTFAKQVGVAPSIVVGRLQHDGILENRFRNELKTFLGWDENNRVIIKKYAEEC